MGQLADAFYIQFLNLERRDEWLIPDPNGIRVLPLELPTKWAVLQVLTKQCWISTAAIKILLVGLGYSRNVSSIRRALLRCQKFGLVERATYFRHEERVLKGKKPRKHSKWKLTEAGRQLACKPPAQVLKGKSKKTYVSPQQAESGEGRNGPSEVRVSPEPRKVLRS